ncbi:hypothetical protein [Pedobacter jamesrossensis]|uniref:Transposase n=1 Tax=Pedobacter jamesrossensis TaxID=1908238 RepID=A0ABV8NKW0_9SPHI
MRLQNAQLSRLQVSVLSFVSLIENSWKQFKRPLALIKPIVPIASFQGFQLKGSPTLAWLKGCAGFIGILNQAHKLTIYD